MASSTTVTSSALPYTQRAVSRATEANQAVAEIAQQLGSGLGSGLRSGLRNVLFFCSSNYDLKILGAAMQSTFPCPTVGCTTAGEIISPGGYIQDALVAVGFYRTELEFLPWFIPSIEEFLRHPCAPPRYEKDPDLNNAHFSLLLVDGVSMMEEKMAALVYRMLGQSGLLIGGSAGDDLRFEATGIYHDGVFHQGAALVALFQTTLPFRRFRIQNFEPTETKMVITGADSANRRVDTINGRPAAGEYARIIGVTVEELTLEIFAAYPVMLKVGGQAHVRSIQQANADGSLSFYSAIEVGLVLTLGRSRSLPQHLRHELATLQKEIPGLHLILGCDCILRRLELQRKNQLPEVAEILAGFPFLGFSTYGEIFSGMHVNQTLTGVAIGGVS